MKKPITLKVKILGLVITTVVLTMGIVTWVSIGIQDRMLRSIGLEHSRVIAESTSSRIVNLMRDGDHAKLGDLLKQVQHGNSLDKVYIFNDQGKVLHSSITAENGLQLPQHLIRKLLNHTDKNPVGGSAGTFYSVKTIPNSTSCHECHDPALANLGRIHAIFSLSFIEKLRDEGYQSNLLAFTFLLVLCVAAISIFFFFYVDNPIRSVIKSMRKLEQGEFEEANLKITSSYELNQVANKFNAMASRLHELILTKVRQEKELAVQQEQLVHQQELQAMNITLEDRLKEIEYLNINLEERIEEIEEANFKIADLAGELESKNTSLMQTVERLSAIYKMGLAINATMDIQKLFDLLLQKSLETLNAKVGYILLFEDDHHHLRVAASVGVMNELPRDFKVQVRKGGCSHWVIEKGEPLLIRDIKDSPDFNRRSLLGFERDTVICSPLMIKGQVVGTMTIANKEDGSRFQHDDLELVSTIAAQASVAINNARLYEEQQRTYLSTVQALVTAIEASDAYTRGHSERVTRYALAIAEEMDLPSNQLRRLEQAAILHDIGKIGIDLSLLHKKGALDAADYAELQKHPEIGQRILEPIHFLSDISGIIAQHHERFDGEGYPCRISGATILLEARILAVADTFDAITSNRPYRDARLREDAISEIRNNSGSQFDPEVVNAFIKVFDTEAAA